MAKTFRSFQEVAQEFPGAPELDYWLVAQQPSEDPRGGQFVGFSVEALTALVSTGSQGPAGPTGPAGPSAYDSEVANGFDGTELEWLASLVGPQGPAGADGAVGPSGAIGPAGPGTYETWLSLGNEGTEQDFLDSLVGPQGPAGADGAQGVQGPAGDIGPAGPGLAAGGETGQVSVKLSGADYHTGWATLTAANVGALALNGTAVMTAALPLGTVGMLTSSALDGATNRGFRLRPMVNWVTAGMVHTALEDSAGNLLATFDRQGVLRAGLGVSYQARLGGSGSNQIMTGIYQGGDRWHLGVSGIYDVMLQPAGGTAQRLWMACRSPTLVGGTTGDDLCTFTVRPAHRNEVGGYIGFGYPIYLLGSNAGASGNYRGGAAYLGGGLGSGTGLPGPTVIVRLADNVVADGDLAADQMGIWFDTSTHKIHFKCKYPDGVTVRTTELALS